MTNEQLIAKFNPANGPNLNAEDLEVMRKLTDAELEVLAEAYPNQPMRRAYLRLYDTRVAENKQLFQPSTWQNLRNVRKFSNFKHLVPYDFIALGKANTPAKIVPMQTGKNTTSPKKTVVDLSAKDAAAELAKSIAKPAEKGSVDKVPVDNTVSVKSKTSKPAPAASKGGAKKGKETAAAVVENGSIPDDQQFTEGE